MGAVLIDALSKRECVPAEDARMNESSVRKCALKGNVLMGALSEGEAL